jgi:hypothetical protein
MVGRKIILVNGSNILGEMLARAIAREPDLDIEYHFHSHEDLLEQLKENGVFEGDQILIVGASDQDIRSAQEVLFAQSDVKTINLAGDGSAVTLRSFQKKTIKNLTLPALLDILRDA